MGIQKLFYCLGIDRLSRRSTTICFSIGITTLQSSQRLSISMVWFLVLSLDSWYVSHQSSHPTPLYPLSEKPHFFHSSPHRTPLLSSASPPQPKPGLSSSVISFRTYRVCKRALETWAASLQNVSGFPDSIHGQQELGRRLYTAHRIYPVNHLTRSNAGDANSFKRLPCADCISDRTGGWTESSTCCSGSSMDTDLAMFCYEYQTRTCVEVIVYFKVESYAFQIQIS
jgi:hypothetical protein